jgi:hypothetical protein
MSQVKNNVKLLKESDDEGSIDSVGSSHESDEEDTLIEIIRAKGEYASM